VTSGELVAVDPLVSLDKVIASFTRSLPRGGYPVILRIEATRVALALLEVSSVRPVTWELGLLPGEHPPAGTTLGYPVDSGTGCYADSDAASIIRTRRDAASDWVVGKIRAEGIEPGDERWSPAYDRYRAQIPGLLSVLSACGYGAGITANACVVPETGANLIAFSSGYGDGSYEVWFGLAGDGAVAAVVTDFQVIDFGRGVHPFIDALGKP
jgi:hypothetical protein